MTTDEPRYFASSSLSFSPPMAARTRQLPSIARYSSSGVGGAGLLCF